VKYTVRMTANASALKPSRFLTVAQVATELAVSEKHVRRAIEREELKFHRFGRVIRVARDALEQYIASRYQ
jgi:excisionase family DNA binding protein